MAEAVLQQARAYISQRATRISAIILVLLTALGAVGLVRFFQHGHHAVNTTQVVPWGLWVAIYVYLVGLSAGAFLLSSLVYVFDIKRYASVGKLALFQALICLVLALIVIMLDLGHPWRTFTMLWNFNPTSVLAWLFIGYGLYMLITFVELVLAIRRDRPGLDATSRQRLTDQLRLLGTLGIPAAVFVHGGVGSVFATIKAQPVWHTGLMPILFLVSALASGGALLTLLAALFGGEDREAKFQTVRGLAKLTVAILSVDALMTLSDILVVRYGGVPDHAIAHELVMFGPFWWVFWVVQVALGTVLPIVLVLWPRTGRKLHWLALAMFLVVIGVVGVRVNIVIPALIHPPFAGYSEAYPHPRFASTYFPSMTEWLVTLLVFCLGAWVFALGQRILPLNTVARKEQPNA